MKGRISAVFLIFLIVFSTGYPVYSAGTDEGYGEDETSLGQFVDSFETSGNISVTVNVTRNATLEVMELNFTVGGITGYENFSDYVHTDPNNKVFPDEYNISFVNYERNDAGRTVFDFGVGAIDSFNYSFEFRVSGLDAGDGSSRGIFHVLIVTQIDSVGWPPDHYSLIQLVQVGADNSLYEWWMTTKDDGASTNTIGGAHLNVGTIYYCNYYMVGTNKTLNVYTDSAMTVQVEHISHIKGNDAYRYLQTIKIIASGTDPLDDVSGYMNELYNGSLAIGSAYASDGYFTTVDYLSDPLANGSALTVLVNTSIPANTDIQFQISDDNATWRDHEGVIGDSEDLLGGFEAIDLRDLNYSGNIYFRGNLSTTDTAVTPRFYQIRLITMIGFVNETTIFQNVTGEWIYYNLTAINVSIGIHDDGFLNSTYFIDGDTYNCSEVVGAPGYVVKFNVTGIDTRAISLWLVNYVYYDGSASHEINVEVWNFSSSAFVEIGEIPDMLGFEWMNFTIYGLRIPNDFVNSTGVLVGRFYHSDPGNVNHDIFWERINVLAFVPLESVSPADEVFQFFWIVIAIALMIIGIVLASMWPHEGDP